MRYSRQISSGGVLFRPSDGGYQVALIRLKGGKVYALPKGLVEEGEDPLETAVREVREETGMEGEPVAPLGYIRYYYYSPEEDTRYFKLVHFFLLRYREGSEKDHDWEVEGVEWMPVDRALQALSYKGEREILKKAAAIIEAAEEGSREGSVPEREGEGGDPPERKRDERRPEG